MEKILNLSKISEIFLDNEEDIKEILILLADSIPEFLKKIEECLEEEDFDQFKFIIHKFKSSCQLVTEAFFIEQIKAIENNPVKEIKELLPSINKLKAMTLQLQQEINNQNLLV